MTKTQIDTIRRALELLHRLVPDDELRAIESAPRRCPVAKFAKQFLQRDPASDMTSAELWKFFGEVSASGEVESRSKAEFLRRLPEVLAEVLGVKKCHCILRDGHRLRGFKCVEIREHACPVTVLELEPG